MPILLAHPALVCSSAAKLDLHPNKFGACPAIMASLTTYLAVVMSRNPAFVTAHQPRLWTGSSVMALFAANATRELSIYQTTL